MIRKLANTVGSTLMRWSSLENPNTPLDADEEGDGSTYCEAGTASGVKLNAEKALTYSPIWRGVNLISGDVAKLPCEVFAREGEGKRRAMEHPAYRLLRRKPNREMKSFDFKKLIIAQAVLHGNGMAYIDRLGSGRPTQLIPLRPSSCNAVRVNGQLWYVINVAGENRKIEPENVFHVKGLSIDGLMGYSLVDKARESLGLGMAARDYGSRFFKNNARPSAVLQHPKSLTEAAAKRLRESWNEIHAGLNNSHKIAILEEGMTLNPFSINARDSQLLETRQFEVREVANWLGIPPHKLGDSSRTAYNSLEQENQSYLDEALDPWLVAFEEEAFEKLLTEEEKAKDTHTVEFKRQALLRADTAARGEFYAKATGGLPWMTGNEVRGRENLNPIDGFDTIRLPTNNWGEQGNTAQAKDAARAVMADAVRRMAKRLAVHARKASKKPDDLVAFLSRGIKVDHRDTIVDALTAPSLVVSNVLGITTTPDVAASVVLTRSVEVIGFASDVLHVPWDDEWEAKTVARITELSLHDMFGDQ
jgi:HK97 family phage portal protein